MKQAAIVGGIAGAVVGIIAGTTAFGSVTTGIGVAIAFGCGVGGVFLALALKGDLDDAISANCHYV